MTRETVPAMERLRKVSNESVRESFLGVVPQEPNGALVVLGSGLADVAIQVGSY
jgi:hypothetical protein